MRTIKTFKIIVLFFLFIRLGLLPTFSAAFRSSVKDINKVNIKELSNAQNSFALKLFSKVTQNDENSFLSPYSIHTALLLAYTGAGENTRKEMANTLSVSEIKTGRLKEKSRQLKDYLEKISPAKETELAVANALFLKDTIPFINRYKKNAAKYFKAEISSLPRKGETVNQWVQENTKDKIEKIINPGPVPGNVIAYLVNAIYFKSIWEEKFDPKKTSERPFYSAQEKEVNMMENKAEYRYSISENIQTVTVPYKDGSYLFHAFMPPENKLTNFYDNLTVDDLKNVKPTDKEKIILRLPKFTLKDDLSLSDILQNMGIKKAFNRGQANFSNMVNLKKISPLNVFINEVFHSSFIEVDEKGTEAAAATAIDMRTTSVPQEPPIIEFNRPFFFMIEEAQTETILFMGQLVNPE